MEGQNALEIKNLTKKYEDFTLDNINITLPAGCIMGLIGENGAGKSTTIQLIMNSIKRDAGEIMVLGCDNTEPNFRDKKEDIGVVLDEAYFPEIITANIVNKMMQNTYKRWEEKTYFDYIDRFALPKDKAFKDFSRGMKMKLAIAVAMSHKAKLLILDEATSGLDPIIRDEILDIFYEFTRNPEHSILISSHIISDLEKLCDYIVFLHKGKLLFCEEKDNLMEQYGVCHCTKEEFISIPTEAVVGKKTSPYGVECLVNKNKMSNAFSIEKATIEDIILFLIKGDRW
ncbi:MAG: ABC transporter ATP-binding protein [Anaerovoracaceae bacterium]